MNPKEQFTEIAINLPKGANCFFKTLTLLSVPIFLFLFAIAGYFKVINFNVEIHSILMIGSIFMIYLFFVRHNAYYASCKLRRNFIDVKADLLKYINKNLLSIAGIEKANAPLDDFLKEEAKTMRNENFSSIAAGIFPTLGILGTFISIAISMPDFSSQTSQVLEEEISKLLGGVGTAFYVSIYGIFLSIWWIFFEKSGMSRFQKDALIIKDATRDYFWQKEEIEQTYFRKSMENFEKLNSVFDTFASGTFVENLNKALAQRMHIFEQIIEHEQKATDKVAKLLEDGSSKIAQLSEEASKNITKLSNEAAQNIAKLSENSSANLAELSQNGSNNIAKLLENGTNEISTYMESGAANVTKILDTSAANVETITNQQEELSKIFHSAIEKFGTFAGGIEDRNDTLNDVHSALSAEFSRAVTIAESLNQNSEKLHSALSNISSENVENLYGGVIENIDSMRKEIDHVGISFDDRVNQFDERFLGKLKNTLKMIDSETATIVSQLSQFKSESN